MAILNFSCENPKKKKTSVDFAARNRVGLRKIAINTSGPSISLVFLLHCKQSLPSAPPVPVVQHVNYHVLPTSLFTYMK